MVEKFMVEKFMAEKHMVENFMVEEYGVEAWGINVLQLLLNLNSKSETLDVTYLPKSNLHKVVFIEYLPGVETLSKRTIVNCQRPQWHLFLTCTSIGIHFGPHSQKLVT